jgi:uncharacterized protein (TIGR02145 family)
MKSAKRLPVLAVFTTCMTIFYSCKKEASIPTVRTTDISQITTATALSGGEVISNGGDAITALGICWSITPGLTIANSKTIEGSVSGTFSSNLTGLEPDTRYYVRAYATNSAGTGYGNEISFTSGVVMTATVKTSVISSITDTTAVSGGDIISNGGATVTDWGICWSTSPNPTFDDWKYTMTSSEGGLGVFTSPVSYLNPGTTYYVRAYAYNSAGISYGEIREFTTTGSLNPIVFNTALTYGSVSDIEGNYYKTIQIGTQVWMAENLKTTRYNDGTTIPEVTDNTEWKNLTSGGYSWYNNDAESFKAIYGALYNWYAVTDIRNICPIGWHTPSREESSALSTYLGDENDAGGKLKEAGTTHWLSPNTGATNETGFTLIPGGMRMYLPDGGDPDIKFRFIGSIGALWTKEPTYDIYSAYIVANYDGSGYFRGDNAAPKSSGLSVRCIKNN